MRASGCTLLAMLMGIGSLLCPVNPLTAKKIWPKPMPCHRILVVDVRYDKGRLKILSVKQQVFEEPVQLIRFTGRFRFEVYHKEKLVAVAPFNFPLLAPLPADGPREKKIRESKEKRLTVDTRVKVPLLLDSNRVVLVDGRTGQSLPVELPSAP